MPSLDFAVWDRWGRGGKEEVLGGGGGGHSGNLNKGTSQRIKPTGNVQIPT